MTLREKTKTSPRDARQWMIIGIVIAAVAVAAIAIVVSSSGLNPNAAAVNYSTIPQNRTPDGAFILGDPNAPVTMIVFEDFLCPHCQDYQIVVKNFIREQVATGRARFEYRFFPAIDATFSYLMANATECSENLRPGSFWDAHDAMFQINSRSRFSNTTLRTFAEQMDLDYSALLTCTQKDAGQIETDTAYGESLGVRGTPTVFIQYGDNAPVLQSPPPNYDQLAALVAAAASQQR